MTESWNSRRLLAAGLAALSLSLSVGTRAWAAEAPPKADRVQQQAAFQAYTDAWATATAEARQQRLRAALSPEMTYQDASVTAEGIAGVDAMIARFQHQSPGFTLHLDDLLLWADHGLAKWSMMDPKGGLIMHGYDAVTYDPAGHIKAIVGFFDVPGQRQAASR